MATTTIHFVRHGTVYNPENIFYGRIPRFGLSSLGIQQASNLHTFFSGKPVSIIFSSPQLRARQTAGIIAKSFDKIDISINSKISEIRSPYDGRPIPEMIEKDWDIYTGNQPPYELPMDVFNRTNSFIQSILRSYTGKQVIAVTHADLILFVTLWGYGHEISYNNKFLVEHNMMDIQFPSPASVTTCTWEDDDVKPNIEYLDS